MQQLICAQFVNFMVYLQLPSADYTRCRERLVLSPIQVGSFNTCVKRILDVVLSGSCHMSHSGLIDTRSDLLSLAAVNGGNRLLRAVRRRLY